MKEIILRGDRIRIETVEREVVDTPTDRCDADFTPSRSLIRIRTDADPQGYFRTLGHEIAHFFLDWGGLDGAVIAACHDKESGEALVEGICDAFGAALIEVIRDNPTLVREVVAAYSPPKECYTTKCEDKPSKFKKLGLLI